jgi:hypothetical protein
VTSRCEGEKKRKLASSHLLTTRESEMEGGEDSNSLNEINPDNCVGMEGNAFNRKYLSRGRGSRGHSLI